MVGSSNMNIKTKDAHSWRSIMKFMRDQRNTDDEELYYRITEFLLSVLSESTQLRKLVDARESIFNMIKKISEIDSLCSTPVTEKEKKEFPQFNKEEAERGILSVTIEQNLHIGSYVALYDNVSILPLKDKNIYFKTESIQYNNTSKIGLFKVLNITPDGITLQSAHSGDKKQYITDIKNISTVYEHYGYNEPNSDQEVNLYVDDIVILKSQNNIRPSIDYFSLNNLYIITYIEAATNSMTLQSSAGDKYYAVSDSEVCGVFKFQCGRTI